MAHRRREGGGGFVRYLIQYEPVRSMSSTYLRHQAPATVGPLFKHKLATGTGGTTGEWVRTATFEPFF